MSTQTLLLNSVNRWLADGTQTLWDFSFAGGYIAKTHVKAYYVLPDNTKIQVVIGPNNFSADFQLLILPAVPAGATLTIYRDTPKDLPLVDWQSGTALTEISLDTMSRQSVFIAAEAVDSNTVIVKGDLEGITAELDQWKATALLDFGFKDMRLTTYTGASTVSTADRGRAHVKGDNTSVTVPNMTPEFFCNILNIGTGDITVTFSAGDTVYKQGDTTSKLSWTLPANQILSIVKVSATKWFISGMVS